MILVTVSTGHFDPLLDECNRLSKKYDFFGQIGSSRVLPQFPYVRTVPPVVLREKLLEAELVISHGGSGLTAMMCRLKKKCILIPKQKRYGEMNDFQVQMAQKWAELGVGEFILDVTELDATIEKVRRTAYKSPHFHKLGIEIHRVMGFEQCGVSNVFPIPGY